MVPGPVFGWSIWRQYPAHGLDWDGSRLARLGSSVHASRASQRGVSMAWVGTAVLALGSGGPPSLVTGGPPAPGVWWWMILAPIFLGEPRLCTQKMVVRARTWRGLHQPGVGCHPAVCARSLLVCLQLWVLTLLGPPMALRQILFGFILSSPVSFETTRSFGRSSPPLRLSNPESPERPLGIR